MIGVAFFFQILPKLLLFSNRLQLVTLRIFSYLTILLAIMLLAENISVLSGVL